MKDCIYNRIARARNPQHFMKKPAAFAAGYQISSGDLGAIRTRDLFLRREAL